MPTKTRAIPAKKPSSTKRAKERPSLVEKAAPIVPEAVQPIDPQPSVPVQDTARTEEPTQEVPAHLVPVESVEVAKVLPPEFHQFAEALLKQILEQSMHNVQSFIAQSLREMMQRATDEARKASPQFPQGPEVGKQQAVVANPSKLKAGCNMTVEGGIVRPFRHG